MFPGGATRSCAGTAPRGDAGLRPGHAPIPVVPLHTHTSLLFQAARSSPGQLRHLPCRVAAGVRLRHREPCRRNRLSSSCPTPGVDAPWCRQRLPSARLRAAARRPAGCCFLGRAEPPRHPARPLPAVKQPGAPHPTALQIQGGIPGIPASLFHLSARGRTDQLGREKFLLRVVLGAGRCFLLFLSSGGSRRLLARHRSHGGIEQVYSKPRSGRAGSMQVRWVYFRLSLLVSVVSFSFRLIPLWALLFSSGLCWFGFKKRCRALICGETEPGCPRRLPLIRTFQLFWFQYPQLDASAGISIVLRCFFITPVKKRPRSVLRSCISGAGRFVRSRLSQNWSILRQNDAC